MAGYPKQRQDVSCRQVDGEVVILDRAAERVHQLNPTATIIWDLCDGAHSAVDIARELAGAFEIEVASVQEDVETTLRQLAELGLVETTTEGLAS